MVDPIHLESFRRLIAGKFGLKTRPQDRGRLQTVLESRIKQLGASGPVQYLEFLQRDAADSDHEWKQLVSLVTTGETSFFRDKNQITVLREHILPDLIERRSRDRSLRIWSAGCASGEEPYSLAILLDQLLPDREAWRIRLLGTDIDVAALEAARRGNYTSWSFRNLPLSLQQKYFHERGQTWEVNESIKEMVSFQPLNLSTDAFPNSVARRMDLIVCRNVFIYFEPEPLLAVVERFAATLREGGYLLTGRGELQGLPIEKLEKVVLRDSLVFRRPDAAAVARRPAARGDSDAERAAAARGPSELAAPAAVPSRASRATTALPTRDVPNQLAAAEQLVAEQRLVAALQLLERLVDEQPELTAAHALLGRVYADAGRLGDATQCCRRVLEIDPFHAESRYLLAHIAEERGEHEEALEQFKKVIYLSPTHIAAHLDMAELLERAGQVRESCKLRDVALRLLQGMPSDQVVDFRGGAAASELIQHLQQSRSDG